MSELDLDAIEASAPYVSDLFNQRDALVAEVRRLRAELSLRDPSVPVPPDTSPLIGHVYGPAPETPLAFFHLGDYHIRDDGTIVDAP